MGRSVKRERCGGYKAGDELEGGEGSEEGEGSSREGGAGGAGDGWVRKEQQRRRNRDEVRYNII